MTSHWTGPRDQPIASHSTGPRDQATTSHWTGPRDQVTAFYQTDPRHYTQHPTGEVNESRPKPTVIITGPKDLVFMLYHTLVELKSHSQRIIKNISQTTLHEWTVDTISDIRQR